ncbi:MAG: MATE family efflux transporter [Oscillospiraceae bacterium]|nr:MATE family efflux transporter [Oscillospiraceae bacterium]
MKKYEMNMSEGPLFRKILMYSLPLALSGMLQLVFNSADAAVVGRFTGATALAAVGSTGALVNLIVNVFMGLSVGASVVAAQYIGARQARDIYETVQTAMAASVVCGVLVAVAGITLSRPLLRLTGSPDDVIDQAALYMRIYFVGMPASMLYNFGAAILRAMGDTKRPLYFLAAASILGVILNLLFVIVFGMGVAGVAWSTVISQTLAAAMVVICLVRLENSCRLDIKHIKIYKDKLMKIIRIGLPAGLQGSVFSISNVVVQSSINSFGSTVMAGNAAAANLDGFVYTTTNAVYQAALAFTSQNVGAKKHGRISRVCYSSCAIAAVGGVMIGGLMYTSGELLLSIYSKDPAVIETGMIRLSVMATTYFLCGLMEVLCGVMRGMGKSVLPMMVSVVGACGIRILWVFTVFAAHRTLLALYLSYSVSWFVTASAHFICVMIAKRKLLQAGKSTEPKRGLAFADVE